MPTCGWSITTWKGRSLVNSIFNFLICGSKEFRTSVFPLDLQNTSEVLAAALLWLPEVLQQLGEEGECLMAGILCGWCPQCPVPSCRAHGDTQHCRKALHRAVQCTSDYPEHVCEVLLTLERIEGTWALAGGD